MPGFRRLVVPLAGLAMVVAACNGGGVTTAPSPGPTEEQLPSVSIGECVTRPDTAIQPAAAKGEDFKTQLKTQGKLTVGSDIAFKPFEYVDPQTNKPVGFDIDLATEVARRLGLEAEFVNTGFDALFTQTLTGNNPQFDVGISAITIKPERQQSVDFSTAYFKADLSLSVPVDSEIRTVDDLKGVTVGTQAATTSEDCTKAIQEDKGIAGVKGQEQAPLAFDDMAAGRVGAVIIDLPAAKGIAEERPNVKIVQVITTEEVYGIAVPKAKPDLRVAINDALEKMFDDGTYAQIFQKHFGAPPPFPLPPA